MILVPFLYHEVSDQHEVDTSMSYLFVQAQVNHTSQSNV